MIVSSRPQRSPFDAAKYSTYFISALHTCALGMAFFFFTVPLASEVVLNGGRAGASGALVILYFYFGEYITIQSVVLTPDVFHFFILI